MPKVFKSNIFRGSYFMKMPVVVKIKDAKGKVKGEKKAYYIPGIDEIFEDEIIRKYGKDKRGEAVQPAMKNGILVIGDDEISLHKFLDIHPDNEKNGGWKFKEYNHEEETTKKVEIIDDRTTAINFIKEGTDGQKKAVAMQFINMSYKNKSAGGCYVKMVEKINDDENGKLSKKIINWFNDKNNETILTITLAIEQDVLAFRGGKEVYLLGDTTEDPDELLYTCKSQFNAISEFAGFLKTKQGIPVLKKISDRM